LGYKRGSYESYNEADRTAIFHHSVVLDRRLITDKNQTSLLRVKVLLPHYPAMILLNQHHKLLLIINISSIRAQVCRVRMLREE